MPTTIAIPPIDKYRTHLRIVLSFILVNFIGDHNGNIPPISFQGTANEAAVKKLLLKIARADPNESLKVTIEDALLLYTSFVMMNKILVSKYDELIATSVLQILPENHPLKKFNAFRDEMIFVNCHLITNTEERLVKKKELFKLKDKLAEIDID